MGELYNTTKQDISYHLSNIFKELELEQNSVVKNYLTTALDGKKYKTNYYNLDAIISVGYRVNTDRAIQFRRWATNVLKEFSKKGYIIDEKRIALHIHRKCRKTCRKIWKKNIKLPLSIFILCN